MHSIVLHCALLLNFVFFGIALKTVTDDDLMDLIRGESHIVALFSSKNCVSCDDFENILNNLEKSFQDSFNGKTVKLFNSQLTRLYSPTKEPIIVFYRHGIPLLYNDVASEELIHHTFLNNKEPVVKELSDDTFEHLTQVATGATTGDWFVMFYTPDCVDCQRLTARWEAVGAHLKSRMNVARVNKAVGGAATADRFKVTQAPTFILFRLGKLYRYQIQKYDTNSFVSFAQEWYKNMKPEHVPHPKTPFDNLVDRAISLLHNEHLALNVSIILFIGALLAVVYCKCRKPSQTKKDK